MTKDTRAGSPGSEQQGFWTRQRTRRNALGVGGKATLGAIAADPLTKIAVGALTALGAAAEAACATIPNSEAKTGPQKAVDASLKLFDQIMSAPGYISQDDATLLIPAAIHAGDVQPAIAAYKSLNGTYAGDTYIDDGEGASLAAISVIQGIDAQATKDAFKSAHDALTNRSSGGWGPSLDDSFDPNHVVTDATNMVGLQPLYSGGLNDVIGVFKRLGDFAGKTDSETGKSLIQNNPGLVALTLRLNELRTGSDGSIDQVVGLAKDLFPEQNLTLSENNFDQVAQEAGILALAAAFKGDTKVVERTYNDMNNRFSGEEEAIPFILTLASAIDGFNSDNIADMYTYAKSYRSNTTLTIDDSKNAAQIVLATAAKDAIDNGRIPPELADVTNNITGVILIGLALWWFLFKP